LAFFACFALKKAFLLIIPIWKQNNSLLENKALLDFKWPG